MMLNDFERLPMTVDGFEGCCPNAPQCRSEEYDLKVRSSYHEFWNPWEHMLSLSYGSSFVEVIHTEPGYDFPTLISEIGGTIGFLMVPSAKNYQDLLFCRQ